MTSRAGGSVSVVLAHRIVAAAGLRGAPMQEILAATSLTSARLEDPNERITHGEFLSLWREAARCTGDEFFGLHLAEINHRWASNALYFAVSTCETFEAVLHCFERYGRLAHDAIVFQRWRDEGLQWVRFAMRPPLELSHHGLEFALARLTLHGQSCVGEAFRLHAIHLPHRAPADLREHERIFGRRPEFEQSHGQLAFDASLLSHRLVNHNAELQSLLGNVLEQALSRFQAESSLRDQVEHAVASRLQHGLPDIEVIAKQLSVSPRTLQRRLQEQGASYLDVVNEARQKLAEQYLRVPTVPLTEIAFLLGFTEPSNFHRAFKRWTGLTPLEARRRALREAPSERGAL